MQLWKPASPNSAGWTNRLETKARADVVVQVQRKTAAEVSLARGRSIFCFVWAFNWLDEAHSRHRGQFVLRKSTDLNDNLNQKHCHRNIQNNVDSHVWVPWLSHLTHKSNYHHSQQIPNFILLHQGSSKHNLIGDLESSWRQAH